MLATFSLIDATSWKRHSYSLNLRCAAAYAYSHSHSHSRSHSHTHTPACAWACGAWHRRMHNESEWQQQLQSRSILYGRRCHNYDHNQRTHKGAMAREGVGEWMIAWAAVALAVASLSGLLLLICRNYSPSHSNIYENCLSSSSKFMRHMFAMSMRAGQRWRPAPYSLPQPLPPSLLLCLVNGRSR